MAHNESGLCKKEGYCEFARFCKKVPEKMRVEMAKERKVTSAIEDAVFITRGAGERCVRS